MLWGKMLFSSPPSLPRFLILCCATITALYVLRHLSTLSPHSTSSAILSYTTLLSTLPHLPNPISNNPKTRASPSQRSDCAPFLPDLNNVVITVKTGASEASALIPTLLQTSLKCFPHVLLFSDMPQIIQGLGGPEGRAEGEEYKFHDSLSTVSHRVKEKNPTFDIYRHQLHLLETGFQNWTLTGLAEAMNVTLDKARDMAWSLDKYKFTHVLEMTWDLLPSKQWYFHIDGDTYIFASTLSAWLKTLDAREMIYGGALVCSGIAFAHGGSGYITSGVAMHHLAVTHKGMAAKMDSRAVDMPFGDLVLAHAMKDVGIEIKNAVPILNGGTADVVAFSYEFEELYKDLIEPTIPSYREHWDNTAASVIPTKNIPFIYSLEDCISACDANEECFQCMYDEIRCAINIHNFGLGVKAEPTEERRFQSWWNRTRIDAWVDKQKCGEVKFELRHDLRCARSL
ncbi:hypothetical protein EJ08DRAFT_653699 [Tothia fuscella]|uniref:Glycosyltransferase family 31 protein n=1 Tax=Tothia fuscella TaxID=1048955 RepID=A0A9P4NH44_9PEZI|nr:hypothetical protein EJ08DRAFT_653699 [Tothia fuscella]